MKQFLLSGLILMSCGLAASAQEKRDTIRPLHKLEQRDKTAERVKMKEELGLSKEQTQKMKEIHEDSRSKVAAIRKDEALSKEDRKAKSLEIMKERNEKVKAILTPDQQTKYRQMGKEVMKERKHRKDDKKKKAETPVEN